MTLEQFKHSHRAHPLLPCLYTFVLSADEVTCTIKPSGSTATLKHIAKKGIFAVKTRGNGQPLLFRPGVEGGNMEFCMLRNPEDQYSFCLYLETQDPSCRLCVVPDSLTSDCGLMILRSCRSDDRDCFVFGSAISVKFTK